MVLGRCIPISLSLVFSCSQEHEVKSYRAESVVGTTIKIDGILDEEAWMKAEPDTGFTFPWEYRPVPKTEFRACYDANHLFFSFNIYD